MIADVISNKKLNPIVYELFIRGSKLNISIVFITQSCFQVPRDVRVNCKIRKIVFNRLSDIEFKDFINIFKKCTKKPYPFLGN